MKTNIKNVTLSFFISLPLVFVLIFIGYFQVHYDIVLQTDGIVGEGICQTYVCPEVAYSVFYEVPFYFGSELKKTTIKG